ncbi:hypothetical protein, partial [Hymenobacter coccineus]|uniref:hypothetical protein n=1 Tax=Hymenobacter coccineus TaxID=1908235 RepID=UPI0013011A9C
WWRPARRPCFCVDAAGRQYPGWGPKVLDFPLAGAAALLSVGGRDVVAAGAQALFLRRCRGAAVPRLGPQGARFSAGW